MTHTSVKQACCALPTSQRDVISRSDLSKQRWFSSTVTLSPSSLRPEIPSESCRDVRAHNRIRYPLYVRHAKINLFQTSTAEEITIRRQTFKWFWPNNICIYTYIYYIRGVDREKYGRIQNIIVEI